jgi:hypothetical protein
MGNYLTELVVGFLEHRGIRRFVNHLEFEVVGFKLGQLQLVF